MIHQSRKKYSRWVLLIALVFAFSTYQPGLADIGPPELPPGGNPAPGSEITQVRMVAETILIELIPTTPAGSLGQAKVTVDFYMQNEGSEPEMIAVRFPLTNLYGSYYGNKEVSNFKAWVGGRVQPTRRINSDYDGNYAGAWAEFPVNFPPGKEVRIKVSYSVEGVGEYPFIAFHYIFETGSGWKGTIGRADLVVRFPYEANLHNVIFDTEIGWSTTTEGGTINGKDVIWQFEDFEPGYADNFSISVVMPLVWRAVLREQENLRKNAEDGEAWGRLGKLYKECFFLRKGFREESGGLELYRLSQEAYQNAVNLLPEDALWQAGFADLLWTHWYYDQYFREKPDYTEVIRALQLLQRSLELSPKNERALYLLDEIRYAFPEAVQEEDGAYHLLLLTATPTYEPSPTGTPEPTSTFVPTDTTVPTLRPTDTPKMIEPTLTEPVLTVIPTPQPTEVPSQPFLPVCGIIGMLPIAYFLQLRKNAGMDRSSVDKKPAS